MTAPLPMTPGRWLALLLGLPVALAIIGWMGLSDVAFAGIGSYPVRLDVPVHGHTVRLSVDQADVSVTQGAGDRLRLTGTARYSIVRSTVTWHTTPSGASVFSRCHLWTGVCYFDYRAVVPASLPVFVSDGSGDLTLRNMTGHINAENGSGNIEASGLSGTVGIQNGSGNISGTALAGPGTVLGDDSGNIHVTGLTSPQVTASNGSGDVSLTFTRVPDQVRVTNGSGNVTLVLPRGVAYRVTSNSASGSNSVDVPTSPTSTHIISVTVQSGNIAITTG